MVFIYFILEKLSICKSEDTISKIQKKLSLKIKIPNFDTILDDQQSKFDLNKSDLENNYVKLI